MRITAVEVLLSFRINSYLHKEGCIFYFGAYHSCDPGDPQFLALEMFWKEFLERTDGTDCVVLVEGSLRQLHNTREKAIKESGEGGLITFLAYRSSICIECPEPPQELLDNYLRNMFNPEVILYKRFAENMLDIIRSSKYTVIFEDMFDQGEIIAIHKRYFEEPLIVENEAFFTLITNPLLPEKSIINKVCREASIFRDRYIVSYIHRLIKTKKNVFVVYGGTHAVMQEAAIKNV
jgi:hypothetical protein